VELEASPSPRRARRLILNGAVFVDIYGLFAAIPTRRKRPLGSSAERRCCAVLRDTLRAPQRPNTIGSLKVSAEMRRRLTLRGVSVPPLSFVD
jgi:hypothetical protein